MLVNYNTAWFNFIFTKNRYDIKPIIGKFGGGQTETFFLNCQVHIKIRVRFYHAILVKYNTAWFNLIFTKNRYDIKNITGKFGWGQTENLS